MMKLSDYVADFVARQGVRHVFLLPGGGAMHLNESFGSHPGLEFICNLHEQACAIAADAYGQFTNNLGVVQVTTGPGGTNALTGVAAAYLDSTPMLVISGQVKRPDIKGDRKVRQIGFQEIDVVGMAQPVTKYAATIMEPETIRFHLEKAAHLARTGRPGPVWIDIPLDVQAAQIEPDALKGFVPDEGTPQGVEEAARAAIDLLMRAERPVILAGNGVRLAGALDDFSALIERLSIPALLTWKAIDFVAEDHPLYCGRPGGTGQRGANFTQQNADFLLVIGARLDAGQTAYSHANFARAARKVMVDIDPAEIDKMQTPIEVRAPFDARQFLRAMLSALDGATLPDWSGWLARAKEWQRRYPLCLPEYWERTDFVDNYVFIEVLGELMAGDDMLVPGSSGQCSEITMQAFKVKAGQRILNSEGLGPMGFGIAAPIGACIASGGRRTVSIDGDGGFIMNVQELETLRRLNLPVKIFILNNNGYGSIRTSQRNYFKGHYVASEPSSGLTLPGWRGVAESYRLPFFRIENHAQLRDGIAATLSADGPAVCEVMIQPDQATMPRVTSKQRADGSLISAPMEDMAPFLEREEFMKNMLVPVIEC
jgi:acetolactate synthase-1/2/3 large subunit